VAGKRLAKLMDFAKTIKDMEANYNDRAQKLVDWIHQTTTHMNQREHENTVFFFLFILGSSHISFSWSQFKNYGSN
jgi:hypothetical protein